MIVVIGGPTASGKSACAVALAKKLNGEIVCADSRQVYQGMTLGTASPTPKERQGIHHHGYGARDPSKRYHVAQFVKDTDEYVQAILKRNHVPILVGGTGLYLRSWRFGIDKAPPVDPLLRKELYRERDRKGGACLHERLRKIDPCTANRIHPRDHVRLVRALEIYLKTGKVASQIRSDWQCLTPRVQATWFLMWPDQACLLKNITNRAQTLFQADFIEEACLLRRRIGSNHPLLQTMGYREALCYSDGVFSREQAIEQTIVRHRQYAKRQRTWFRRESWWIYMFSLL